MNKNTKNAKLAALLLAVAGLWMGQLAPAAAQACPPNTCCGTTPTPGAPPCAAAAGNPLNVMSGNKFQREVDMPALPGVLGLELVRYYNSESALSDQRGILGRGWRLSYEEELVVHPGGESITVHQGDGTQGRYFKTLAQLEAGTTLFNANQPGQGSLRARRMASGTEYTVTLGGKLHTFDAQGKLVRITAPTGEYVSLQRDVAGFLLRVTDPQGRHLSLGLLPAREVRAGGKFRGVQHIDSPVGRFGYTYGSQPPQGSGAEPAELLANLVKVSLPTHYDPGTPAHPLGGSADRGVSSSSISRSYHYEDPRHPTLLTGISVQGQGSDGQLMDQRLVTWSYDTRGRANLSVKGRYDPQKAGPEQVTLEFQHKASDGSGTTVLTNSLGQTTRYSHAQINGRPQLLEVRGAGCASCGPVNVQYRYDSRGRRTHEVQLDPQGRPVGGEVIEYDGADRVVRIAAIRYRDGKAGTPQMRVRYEYGPDPRNRLPVLIARPSVVAGKEHTLRIAYNDKGQPVRVVEEGFSPTDALGNPGSQGTPIRRETLYGYEVVNGRSVLTRVDGPLPNGPKGSPEDSDVTRIEWDRSASFATAIVRPLNQRTTVLVDEAGRTSEVAQPEGWAFHYRYSYSGDLEGIDRRVAGRVVDAIAYRRDALGRVSEELQGFEGGELPRRRQAHDAAGRLLWQADALGILRQARYDTEGRVLASVVVGAGVRQEERYGWDAAGRLEWVQDNTGAVRRLVHDPAGRLVATVDPLGRWTRFEREQGALRVVQAANTGKPLVLRYELDDTGRLQAVSAQATDGVQVARTVKHRRFVDDFGREVAVINPDSGTELRRFDAADHIVQVLQADGSVVDLAYDAAGRLVRRTAAGKASEPQTVRYVFEGSRLVRIEDPQQIEHYAYDERGRVQAKSIALRLDDGHQAMSTVHYRYDARGLLAARSLPDGSELQYERDGQGQIVAVHRQASAGAWFGWGKTTLAKDLQRDLVGLARITYGNGVQGQWQRSKEGVLARVVYTAPPSATSAVRTALESMFPDARAQSPQPAMQAGAAGAFGLPRDPKALWDSRLLFDAAGNLVVHGQFADGVAAQPAQTVLTYDEHDQLAQALRASPGMLRAGSAAATTAWRYHHDSLGNRLFGQQAQPAAEMAHTLKVRYAPESDRSAEQVLDAAGRPLQDARRRYEWDGLGRLRSITQDGQVTTYRYNRLGQRVAKHGSVEQHYLYDERRHRIAELDAQGRLTRQYVWLADQLLAVIDSKQPQPLSAGKEGLLQRVVASVQAAWQWVTGKGASIAYVHVNHLGAPVAMTDEQARPVWKTEYAPFGQRIGGGLAGVIKTAAGQAPRPGVQDIRLDLRLPGQWEDEESGLYYNDQRYYDPVQGRYISPDPLGIDGGLNAFAYVNNNPLGFGDPLGLLLFAFDGTGNSDPAAAGDSITNVRKFYTAYDELANGGKYYITGIGTTNEDMTYKGSVFTGDGFNQRVDLGFTFLNKLIDGASETSTLDIDVVGFSRGAAEARVWTNLLVKAMVDGAYTTKEGKKRCLNLRFEGLWDTVPHLGLAHGDEKNYDFGIPAQMKFAAQAVALNEHRGGIADFDGRSIFDAPQTSSVPTRLEIGFVGSHADIGGGYGTGDLSDAALMWMVKQATDQGIKFRDVLQSNGWNVISNPILHDKSDNNIDTETFPLSYGDREFVYGSGTKVKQSQAIVGGNDTEWARGFVDYYHVRCGPSGAPAVGVVDMARYSEWLKSQGANITYTDPTTAQPCN